MLNLSSKLNRKSTARAHHAVAAAIARKLAACILLILAVRGSLLGAARLAPGRSPPANRRRSIWPTAKMSNSGFLSVEGSCRARRKDLSRAPIFVRIEVTIPNARMHADSLGVDGAGHEDIFLALSDAFNNAKRHLQDSHRKSLRPMGTA
jgi:hypothetical protein